MLGPLGFALILAAVLVALHTGTSDDGGLRIFDGGCALALAVIGSSLVAT